MFVTPGRGVLIFSYQLKVLKTNSSHSAFRFMSLYLMAILILQILLSKVTQALSAVWDWVSCSRTFNMWRGGVQGFLTVIDGRCALQTEPQLPLMKNKICTNKQDMLRFLYLSCSRVLERLVVHVEKGT